MFRQLTKLVQPASVSSPQDPLERAVAGGRIRPEIIRTNTSPVEQESSRLQQIDLSLSLNLLRQAAARFSELKPGTGRVYVDQRLIEELRQRIVVYESERLRLRSDLEYAQHCAHSYWNRCKNLEAELDQIRNNGSNNSTSKAIPKRGVL